MYFTAFHEGNEPFPYGKPFRSIVNNKVTTTMRRDITTREGSFILTIIRINISEDLIMRQQSNGC